MLNKEVYFPEPLNPRENRSNNFFRIYADKQPGERNTGSRKKKVFDTDFTDFIEKIKYPR